MLCASSASNYTATDTHMKAHIHEDPIVSLEAHIVSISLSRRLRKYSCYISRLTEV